MTMKRGKPTTILELDMADLDELLQRAKSALAAEDYEKFEALVESYAYLTNLVGDKNTSIDRLRKLLFGASTEKTDAVLDNQAETDTPQSGDENDVADSADSGDSDEPGGSDDLSEQSGGKEKPRPKGHGRNGADAYPGAEKITVTHPSLEPGHGCPDCGKGTVYAAGCPGVLVRVKGQAPLHATVYELDKLRCNLCGKVFTAEPPEGVGSEKYDATAGSMIGLLKYGTGLPFNRLDGLQLNLGIPLPTSTQWEIVLGVAESIEPAYIELIRQAAQGDVLYNDDTTVKILELMGERARKAALAQQEDSSTERTGLFTSGVVSTRGGRRIALFFSGRQHAGENLMDVLMQRAAALGPPIQMCDGLSRNLPGELETILANCLAHGRRKFVDVVDRFPDECRVVLEALKVIYKNDAAARKQALSPEARLKLHQEESGPTMKELKVWLTRQFDERLVEPNSALGEAISYLLKRWEPLTLFLRKPGAPLDNNICERALKKAILHRKNSLFYRSERGAWVGDLFMSLIYTCQLCQANPFDYLTELQRHVKQVAANPQDWLPWNYRETLDQPSPPAQARPPTVSV